MVYTSIYPDIIDNVCKPAMSKVFPDMKVDWFQGGTEKVITKMAGEIVIDDNAIVSANVLMHQFCHVGSHVMIQGGCRFSKDIPPYIIAGREPIAFSGINIIGLRRRGFANEVIERIHNAYRIIYQSGLNTTEALKKIEDEFEKSPEIDYIINFIRNSERGIIK